MGKICFKCKKEKTLDSFYKHPQMKEGVLNKCKECCKKESIVQYNKNITNPSFMDKERLRGRKKDRSNQKQYPELKEKWISKFPEKRAAHLKSQHLKKPFQNAHGHHWSYNETDYKSVIWLTSKEHATSHRFINYDQERKMYRRFDNNILLDSKESHEIFIRDCIKKYSDDV